VDDQMKIFSDLSEIRDKKISRLLPIVENCMQSILHACPQLNIRDISTLIKLISSMRISNISIFHRLIDQLMENDISNLRPSIALKFISDLGWAGVTHSRLVGDHMMPIFSRFRNYHALTSVYMIGGGFVGLDSLVESVMETVRNDFARSIGAHKPTVETHCQLIRRFVVCGYYKEAFELFNQFPMEAYLEHLKKPKSSNSVSQIYRLYLASIVAPEIVPRTAVECLRIDAVRANIESQTMYDAMGGSRSANAAAAASQNSSFIHTLVVNALGRLGLETVSEYIEPTSLLTVDIYVPSLSLGIEVQGPSHYITDLATGETCLRPEDGFKIKVLEKVGIKIEMVSIHDFGRNNATRNSDEFVCQLIQKYRKFT